MLTFLASRPQLSARITLVAGAIWAGLGAVQAARPDWVTTTVLENPAEHVMMAGLALGLLAMVPGYALLSTYATGAMPARFVAAGSLILAFTVTASNVNGDDPSWFAAGAIPGNAGIFLGSIALAVLLRRAGRVPTWVWAGLPLSWVAAFPLSPIGGPLLAGGYWLAVGYMLLAGAFDRREPVVVTAS